MSTSYFLICEENRIAVRVGQGDNEKMGSFYSGEPETMQELGEFLKRSQGLPLRLVTEHEYEDLSYHD